MLQPAFSAILSASARRDEEIVAIATSTRSNEAERENSENPEGYGQFRQPACRFGLDVSQRIHLRPCFFCLTKFASIAAEDTFEMGSSASLQ